MLFASAPPPAVFQNPHPTFLLACMQDENQWKRISQEVKLMEKLNHPRVIRLFETVSRREKERKLPVRDGRSQPGLRLEPVKPIGKGLHTRETLSPMYSLLDPAKLVQGREVVGFLFFCFGCFSSGQTALRPCMELLLRRIVLRSRSLARGRFLDCFHDCFSDSLVCFESCPGSGFG